MGKSEPRLSARLGRCSRLIAVLSCRVLCPVSQEPEFDGRQVVTFHNQRDYIFVRFHRYVFAEGKGDGKEKKTRARLQVGDAAARLPARAHKRSGSRLIPCWCSLDSLPTCKPPRLRCTSLL